MSHLPPPPPNAAPYPPPPPPQHGGQQYQYPPQVGYQHPPPPPPSYQNGFHQSPSSPPSKHHQHNGHDRPPKSKMIVTRYPRPPPHQQPYPSQPRSGPYHHPPPPPPAVPYPQPHWNQSPSHGPPPPSNYPPPPSYAQPPGNQYPAPPPPQPPAPYAGYGQQPPSSYPPPPAQAYPPPPPHSAAAGRSYLPPPPNAPNTAWTAPVPGHPPHASYSPSPAPSIYQAPPPSITPTQSIASIPPPHPTPGPDYVAKDRNDPTFYDGWDDGEFEYGAAVWIPAKGDTSHEVWSLGQYIWHPAAQVTRTIPTNVDDPVPLASLQQKYDPAHFVISSKYYETEDGEGHEYVYNFQRIRYVDAWKERKEDPLFKIFTNAELHEDVVPADEVFQQVLTRPKDTDQVDVTAELEANVTAYLNGTKGGTGKNVEKENVLASLGVTGAAKPVFATPFPAYNPPPDDAIQPGPRRSTFHPKREAGTPAPQRSGFNPFKASSNLSRQPTPRSSSYSRRPSPSATPATLQHAPHSQGHSYQGSPSVLSPDYHQPTPPQAARYPPPPPPSGGYSQSHPAPPPPPPQHSLSPGYGRQHSHHGPLLSPSHDYRRSPTISPYDDPWKVSNGNRDGTPAGPGTPAGSDFGDFHANGHGTGSAQHTPVDSHDLRKRKIDEPDPQQRKRSKAKGNIDSAYQRRW